MPPRVSIIVPIYNGHRYVDSLLATVQAQTLDDWELHIVDDGSTDDTVARLDQAAPDARRCVIRQSNRGLAAARNAGLASARGQYVAFLDVDDAWHPSYLAHMCAALDQAPTAVAAFAGWQYMDATGRLLPQKVLLSDTQLAQLDDDLLWRNSILPSSLVARGTAIARVGGFDETLRACEDWDLWLRLRASGPFTAVPHILMWYRVHSESMTEDVAGTERERLRLNAKHLGPLDAPLADWPAARRQAVGFTYFNAALGFLWQGQADLGRQRVRQAIELWPALLDQDEFYYELGCAFQPRGLRGSAEGLNLDASAALIRDIVFTELPSAPARRAQAYWGRACLILARLARNTRNPRASQAYSLRALVYAPGRQRLLALRLLARNAVPDVWLGALRR